MWKNFDFNTSRKLASNKGFCRGMVNSRTGEILAVITYGLMQYTDKYKLNVVNKVNDFPYTMEDKIILTARKCLQ